MKKEFTMKEVFTMWLKSTKDGKNTYLSGQTPAKERLVGFINSYKKNPKEPDIRIYKVDAEGKAEKEEYTSLWVNVSKNGKKYISGKIGDIRVVGFISAKGGVDTKIPYFSIYESEEKAAEETLEQVEIETADVPF